MQLFLSTVSDEFRSYRDHLRHALDRPNVTVKVQEDFIVSGTPTLEMLDDYIRHCDGVIHLVGDMTGSPARAQSLAAIQERYPDLAQKLTPISECLHPGGPSLSYTQWEAWLALLHGRKLFIATADAQAPRDGKYVQDPAQIQAQQDHLCRLRGMERYPGVNFTSADHLAWNLLRSYILDGLVEARLDLLRLPPTASCWTWPRPWDFSGYLREKRQGFIGRRWLFEEVRAWHGNPAASQALLIVADYGVGKSAFMAELTATGTAEQGLPIAAHHFCDHSTAATMEAATFVRSVAAQLAGAMPAYQAAVEADPEARRWLDEAQIDPASAFSQAVIAKLQGISAPAAPWLLLVDGLDETLAAPFPNAGGNGSSIVALLASGTGRLPPWLRVLATSRRRQEVRQPLQQVYTWRELDAEQAANRDDILDYVMARCRAEPLASLLATAANTKSHEFVAELLGKKSGGKFLYPVRVLNDLACGHLQADRLEDLPPGMDGFYLDAFKRRFSSADDYTSMGPLLGLLGQAHEPLDRGTLAAILGMEEQRVQQALLRIEDFLRITPKGKGPPGITGPTYAFDHLSLVQWLTEEDDEGFGRARDFAVDGGAAWQRLHCWAMGEVAAARAHTCPYLTRHIAAHLDPAHRGEAFAVLLWDLRWLEARLRWADLNALLADFQKVEDPRLRTLERALRQGAHVVANNPDQLLVQLLARWPRTTQEEPAEHNLRSQAADRLLSNGDVCPLTASLQQSEALLRTLKGHAERVNALAVLSDGILASASEDRTIKLWDLDTGECIATLEGHSSSVNALAVLPDGHLASASGEVLGQDNTIKLWDPDTCACLDTLKGHTSWISALALVEKGRFLVSAGGDRAIKLWDLRTGASQTLRAHSSLVNELAVMGDGRLISAAGDGFIMIGKLSTGVYQTFRAHSTSVTAMAVLGDGLLASAAGDGCIKVWNLGTGECLVFQAHSSFVTSLVMLSDGSLASSSGDQTIKFWNPYTSECHATLRSHPSSVSALAVLGVDCLASAYDDGTISIWNLASGSSPTTNEGHAKKVVALAALSDGRLASSISQDCIIKVWNPDTRASHDTLQGHAKPVTALAALSDGRLASGSEDGTIKLWDLDKGECLVTFEGHSSSVSAVAALSTCCIASASHYLTTNSQGFATSEFTLKVWNLHSRKCLLTIKGCSSTVNALTVMENGNLAFASGEPSPFTQDNYIKLWDPVTGACLATIEGHSLSVNALTVLPDGWLVSGSDDCTIRLWDPATGNCAATLKSHIGSVNTLAVLPGGRLASGSADNTIKLWDPASRELGSCQLLFVADAAITAMAFLPAASILVAGDASGRVHWLRLPGA